MTKQIGPYDYQTLHVRQDRGYQVELYERRLRRLVVNSQGQPKTFLPEYVSPDAWKRWVGRGDKVIDAYQLVKIIDRNAAASPPSTPHKKPEKNIWASALPAAR